MPDRLPDCLSACLPVRPVTGWPYAEPACGFTPKAIHSLPWAGLEPSGDPFPDSPSLSGPPFLRIIEPFPAVPPFGERKPSQNPRLQGARPLWSRFKRRPYGQGAGMQSAGKPPTPDAIWSPHRLSGFRTRAPLRRSGNRPVRTVGRNGGVWYMMRNVCKTHVMMQCHAYA